MATTTIPATEITAGHEVHHTASGHRWRITETFALPGDTGTMIGAETQNGTQMLFLASSTVEITA